MTVALLRESPPGPSSQLGPYRRRDYEALPDEPRCELIYGSLFVSPSPSPLHQTLLLILSYALRESSRQAGGRVLVAPLDVFLSDHSVVQPDILYFCAERRGSVRRRVEEAPDLVVEILSPGTARRDRGEKLRLYAEAGVREYWLVDPEGRQIEFLVNEDGRFTVALPMDGDYQSQKLPEIQLDLVTLWREIEEELAEGR